VRFKQFLIESITSEKARQMGLQYFGFGKYGSNGKVEYIAHNGNLIPFNAKVKQSMDANPSHKHLKRVEKRVYEGEPRLIQSQISKQTAGAIGEHIAVAYLKSEGIHDAEPLNSRTNNFPVDLIGDHVCVEVKTGLISNQKGAQHWRATIGQPGKKETEWLKTASKDEKSAWNKRKNEEILARKNKVLEDMTKKYGTKIKAKTLTTIINPDTHMADVYMFDGFHSAIRWNSDEAKKAYVGSFHYGK
jgi:hypothetical protein